MLPLTYGETWAGISAALFGSPRRRAAGAVATDSEVRLVAANESDAVSAPAMTVTRTDGPTGCVLRIEGSLDVHSAPEVRSVFDAIVASRPEMVTIDLEALTMLDSSGVGAIVGLFKRVRAAGGSVRVQGVKGQPLAVCKLLKLDRVFGI